MASLRALLMSALCVMAAYAPHGMCADPEPHLSVPRPEGAASFESLKPVDPRHRRSLRTAAIDGGTAVTGTTYNFIALIQYTDSGPNKSVHYCTGSLFSPTKVLTAGHCCYDQDAKSFIDKKSMTVLIGTSTLEGNTFGDLTKEEGVLRRVSDRRVPDNYSQQKQDEYDICVIVLTKAVPSTITPATLASSGSTLPVGSFVIAIGWGYQDGSDNVSQLKKASKVTDECNYSDFNSQYSGGVPAFLCYDGTKTGACYGDSGGPLLVGTTIYGTDSSGAGDCGTLTKEEEGYINIGAADIRLFIDNITPATEGVDAAGLLAAAKQSIKPLPG